MLLWFQATLPRLLILYPVDFDIHLFILFFFIEIIKGIAFKHGSVVGPV